MELTNVATLLERNGEAIVGLLENIESPLAEWRPAPGKWSVLEVACHLLDEEREDFRQRIRLTLENPQQEWPRIDPERWVTERDYMSRNLPEVVAELRRERDLSVEWLRTASIDLEAGHMHPQLGRMRVGDLLVSWGAHDLLHLRQLTRLQFEWLERVASPYSIRYAGSW